MLNMVSLRDLAAIQYAGSAGTSCSCLDALYRMLALPERPQRALLLTSGDAHAFLVEHELEGTTAVKSGFRSGYCGEGPAALADALRALEAMQVEVEEVEVASALLERLDSSAMTRADLRAVADAKPIRPVRYFDYIYAMREGSLDKSCDWGRFPLAMPWPMLDTRLVDLALKFAEDPDKAIMDGFRRLEDILRHRTSLDEHGAKLCSKAFTNDDSPLAWFANSAVSTADRKPIDKGEQSGRAQLFAGAFMTFRNPRAHRTPGDDLASALSEFLLLNQLYLFEAAAVVRPEIAGAPRETPVGHS